MNKLIKKIMAGMWMCILFACIGNLEVYGATVNITVGNVEVAQGETVNVPVSLTADEVMGVAEVYISYDNAYLEYNSAGEGAGGAGMVKFIFSEMDETGKGKTFNISFTAKVAGTTAVTVDTNTRVLAFEAPDPEQADMQLAVTNGQVNITAPVEASSDCNLTDLYFSAVQSSGDSVNVNFIPAFSPDILEYKADVPMDTQQLVVSTTLSDDKATTKVTGTRIDPGENKTTVIVVAEDGTQKSYILYTTRPTEEPSTEEPPSEEQPTEVPTETTTSPEIDRSPILVEALNKYIIQDFTLVTAPEGYEESYSNYNDRAIAVFRGINKPFALVSLADTPEGAGAAFYILNEVDGGLTKLVDVTAGQKVYTIVPVGADYPGPEGYAHTMLDVNGDMVNAWYKGEESEFYVIYAMNYDGVANLYVYDTVEKTVQRFAQDNKPSGEIETPKASYGEIQALQQRYQNLDKQYKAEKKRDMIFLIVLGIICAGLLIGCIMLLFKANILKEDDDNDLQDDEEDETVENKYSADKSSVGDTVSAKVNASAGVPASATTPTETGATASTTSAPVSTETGATASTTSVPASTETPEKAVSKVTKAKEEPNSIEAVKHPESSKSETKNTGLKHQTVTARTLDAKEKKEADKILSKEAAELRNDVEKIMQGLAELDSDNAGNKGKSDNDDLEIEFVDLDD